MVPKLDKEAKTGVVSEIERWALDDGPGIRTLVFLKGCPLRCQWCANPESQIGERQIGILSQKCIDCGNCTAVCPNGVALAASQGGFKDRRLCAKCGKCIEACPSGAREWIGEYMSVDQVMDIIRKDMAFYRRSGGGVTFSGGEPLFQPDFLRHLLKRCNALGINTALETCGYFRWEASQDILRSVGLVFLDIKHMDQGMHEKVTGVSNKLILENAAKIARGNIPLVIRIPVVPSLNDSHGNIRATADFVRRELASAVGIQLLPYHRLGIMKYEALGLTYELDNIETSSEEEMALLREVISEAGVRSLTSSQEVGQGKTSLNPKTRREI